VIQDRVKVLPTPPRRIHRGSGPGRGDERIPSSLHKALQEGGDRHQPQAAVRSTCSSSKRPAKVRSSPRSDREPVTVIAGSDREQGFPRSHIGVGESIYHGAEERSQNTAHQGELWNGEAVIASGSPRVAIWCASPAPAQPQDRCFALKDNRMLPSHRLSPVVGCLSSL